MGLLALDCCHRRYQRRPHRGHPSGSPGPGAVPGPGHALLAATDLEGSAEAQSAARRPVAVLLANTGLRIYELYNLRLEDVQISERKGKVFVRGGKGEKYREVPLNAEAWRALGGIWRCGPR